MKSKSHAHNKLNNQIVFFDNIKFHSIKEKNRYIQLKKEQEEGRIQDLQLQAKFVVIPTIYEEKEVRLKTKTVKKKVCLFKECSYYADFTYYRDGEFVVEDTKGYRTKEYAIKRKLMKYFHDITILET